MAFFSGALNCSRHAYIYLPCSLYLHLTRINMPFERKPTLTMEICRRRRRITASLHLRWRLQSYSILVKTGVDLPHRLCLVASVTVVSCRLIRQHFHLDIEGIGLGLSKATRWYFYV
jgi:hypothetical protein